MLQKQPWRTYSDYRMKSSCSPCMCLALFHPDFHSIVAHGQDHLEVSKDVTRSEARFDSASESIQRQISCTASVSHFPSTKDAQGAKSQGARRKITRAQNLTAQGAKSPGRGQSEGSAPNVIGFGTSHTDNIRKTRFL